ncbi:hypothetical protein AKJ45_00360 [candidate division MSBL1 archaeon SCGC-AAA261F19]|uniref:UspA domain-containing protein n=2 Tax=candidate division MSBL1 TaxID=215777 RepID=A0A133VBE5_9EURY|nr:hypothetical protein AKJ43_00360 [candidate division MSBL1 archaeon SCGC-AAA261D19]KXB03778.1 hypothetical protein AKJ45_00360 [candidate division MSBL1 archaeon SCGC-AAA261F19]
MKKVLVAVDGSEYSERAFEYSFEDAKKLNHKLKILSVVQSTAYGGEILERALKSRVKRAEEFTEKLKKKAEKEGVDVDSKIITGVNVSTEIAKFAEENDYDLIVMGSRGKTELGTIHLGSVSEGVVRRAHCSVLIVR